MKLKITTPLKISKKQSFHNKDIISTDIFEVKATPNGILKINSSPLLIPIAVRWGDGISREIDWKFISIDPIGPIIASINNSPGDNEALIFINSVYPLVINKIKIHNIEVSNYNVIKTGESSKCFTYKITASLNGIKLSSSELLYISIVMNNINIDLKPAFVQINTAKNSMHYFYH